MKEIKPNIVFSIDRLPFYVGLVNPEQKPQLPAVMPFSLYVDEHLAVPRMVRTRAIEEALDSAYSFGSMLSTPLGESTLATERMEEVIAMLGDKSGGVFDGKCFVEVGAGNGALLNAVRGNGANVIGFEIGPQAEVAKQRFDLTMIRGELSSEYISGEIDCIYSYGCLEHIYEPHEFVDLARRFLVPGGLFFHRVPNSMPMLKTGDIQGLCHEHVNYFTPVNAVRLLSARGFVNCGAKPSRAGNEMDIWGYADPDAILSWPGDDPAVLASESELLQDYQKSVWVRLNHQIERLRARALASTGRKLGFYAGGHILASLADIAQDSRFFDGDEAKWGKCWLDGLSPIEAPSCLRSSPPDVVIVCAEHYFAPIYAHLRKTVGVPEETEIIPLSKI